MRNFKENGGRGATSIVLFAARTENKNQRASMIPFEALLPYGVIITMVVVAATGSTVFSTLKNDGKKQRLNKDDWDRLMIERDLRLTGRFRAQTDELSARPGFELSSTWKANRVWDD
ncbi:hypothetical protein V1514DRAFT_328703 [Lipomyces japonicus]|uniref:uncharacterized protein n=1 Tax=Lipomyces japonicus TaxID=56871 RepID=UPI0034CE4FCB